MLSLQLGVQKGPHALTSRANKDSRKPRAIARALRCWCTEGLSEPSREETQIAIYVNQDGLSPPTYASNAC